MPPTELAKPTLIPSLEFDDDHLRFVVVPGDGAVVVAGDGVDQNIWGGDHDVQAQKLNISLINQITIHILGSVQ